MNTERVLSCRSASRLSLLGGVIAVSITLFVSSCAALLGGTRSATWVEGTGRHPELAPGIKSIYRGGHLMSREGYQPVKVAVVTEWEPQRHEVTGIVTRRLIGANVAFFHAGKKACTAAGVWFSQEHLGGGRYGALQEYASFGSKGTRAPENGITVWGGFGDAVECGVVMDSPPAGDTRTVEAKPGEVSSDQEAKLRAIGGEEMVADARMIVSLDTSRKQGEYQAIQCFRKFLLAHKQEKEGEHRSARGNFRSCVVMCESTLKRDPNDALQAFAPRYVERCGKRQAALDGVSHLERAKKKLVEFKAATGSVNAYYRSGEVRGALKQATESLGDDHAELASVRADYEAAHKPRARAIKRVGAFMSRRDIQRLRTKIADLKAEVGGLEKDARWSEHARAVLSRKRHELRGAELKFTYEMRQAKL